MSDPRLSSPSSIRLVAAAAAAIASLGVVALGVQLGTNGLVGDGPGRNPGSNSATPASATVDLPRARSGVTLDDTLIALVPAAGANAFGSSSSAGAFSPSGTPAGATTAAPAGPADGGSAPAPAPGPVPPAPTLPAPTVPAGPTPTVPTPPATIPPILDPVVEPIDDALGGLGVTTPGGQSAESTPAAPTTTLDGLIRLLLGP